MLYDELLRYLPTSIVELNRAVAVYKVHGAGDALNLLEEIQERGDLQKYLYFHTTLAEFYREVGRTGDAERSLNTALPLADNVAERRLLEGRLERLRSDQH